MTAIEIFTRRTGVTDQSDIDFYIEMAETRIRSYLGLEETEDISTYMFSIAEIAVLYWQQDQSSTAITSSFGYESESFQEGSVRHTIKSASGASIRSTYEQAIIDVLGQLDYKKNDYEVRFL